MSFYRRTLIALFLNYWLRILILSQAIEKIEKMKTVSSLTKDALKVLQDAGDKAKTHLRIMHNQYIEEYVLTVSTLYITSWKKKSIYFTPAISTDHPHQFINLSWKYYLRF